VVCLRLRCCGCEFAAACLAVRRGGLWLEGVFEVAYTYGWRKAEVVNLTVGQVRFESPSDGYIHLPGDQSKNRQGRRVPFSSAWCPRLVEILQAAVAGKSPEERVFTRGKQQDMPVKRFDKLWRVVAGVSEELLVHDLRRTACRNMLSAGFTETRIMEICGWKSRSMFQRYALTNPADLKREIPKLGEYWEHARAGRKAVATVVARRGEACRSEQRRASVRNNRAEMGQTSRKPAARALATEFAVVRVSGRRKTELAGV
jgi:integrase